MSVVCSFQIHLTTWSKCFPVKHELPVLFRVCAANQKGSKSLLSNNCFKASFSHHCWRNPYLKHTPGVLDCFYMEKPYSGVEKQTCFIFWRLSFWRMLVCHPTFDLWLNAWEIKEDKLRSDHHLYLFQMPRYCKVVKHFTDQLHLDYLLVI